MSQEGIVEKTNITSRFFFLIFGVLAVAAASASAQSTMGERDFQIWSETTINVPLIKKKDSKGKEYKDLTLLFIGSLRLGRNKLFPVDERVGIGFDKHQQIRFDNAHLHIQVR